jgi:ubiquinone biosynthesis monooxygenase Coq7
MREREIIPCAMLKLWGVGGLALGITTGLFGRSAILACTVAVERTVHRHPDDQLVWLVDREAAVWSAIKLIQVEELAHLNDAQDKSFRMTGVIIALDRAIGSATAALIWLSTYGASSRMASRIRQER